MKNFQSLFHLGYWLIAYAILIGIFSIAGELIQGVLFASILLPIVVVATYLFVYKLVTDLWFRGKKMLFILSTIVLLAVVIQIELLLVASFLITFGEYEIIKVNPSLYDIYVMVSATLLVALPAMIIEVAQQWKLLQEKPSPEKNKVNQLTVRSQGKNVLVQISVIQYLESYGDVIKINSDDRIISIRKSLSQLEKELPGFIRIHRSFLVNPTHIQSYTSETVQINKNELPVGRTYKDAFLKKMDLISNG